MLPLIATSRREGKHAQRCFRLLQPSSSSTASTARPGTELMRIDLLILSCLGDLTGHLLYIQIIPGKRRAQLKGLLFLLNDCRSAAVGCDVCAIHVGYSVYTCHANILESFEQRSFSCFSLNIEELRLRSSRILSAASDVISRALKRPVLRSFLLWYWLVERKMDASARLTLGDRDYIHNVPHFTCQPPPSSPAIILPGSLACLVS
nr:hypothetical protein CFP56_21367 [Quercus suber]